MESINRVVLKENAKKALRNNFWLILAVVFVGGLLNANWNGLSSGGSGAAGYSAGYSSGSGTSSVEDVLAGADYLLSKGFDVDIDYEYDELVSEDENIRNFYYSFLEAFDLTHEEFMDMLVRIVLIAIGVIIVLDIILCCIRFIFGSFVSAPVGVGMRRFFMKNRMSAGKFKDLFCVFSKGNYIKVVKTMFSVNIRLFGWGLLFYFPGLVKYYQYFFVPYIMAENPNISSERAREISKQMTDNHKWEMFVLNLSFLGWGLLCAFLMCVLILCSCGILALPAVLLTYPLMAYQQATYAELYTERREYALMTGMVAESELIGF